MAKNSRVSFSGDLELMFVRCMYPDQILPNERELIVFLCHFIIYAEYKKRTTTQQDLTLSILVLFCNFPPVFLSFDILNFTYVENRASSCSELFR